MAIQPQTIGNEILTGIHELLAKGRIVPGDDPRIVKLSDDIDRLECADQTQHLTTRAMLIHLTGDTDGALDELGDNTAFDYTRLVILGNHGRCLDALPIYRRYGNPEGGLFSISAHFAPAIGAFSQVATFARAAQRLKLTNLHAVPLERIYMVANFLDEFGISDEQVCDVMQTAGTVLLEHGLMFLGPAPEVDVLDAEGELRTVHLTYRIATSPTEAVGIYMDFVNRLDELDKALPDGLHISFAGSHA